MHPVGQLRWRHLPGQHQVPGSKFQKALRSHRQQERVHAAPRRLLGRQARLLIKRQAALPLGGHHVGVDVDGHAQLRTDGEQAVELVPVLRCKADAELHLHALLTQQAHAARDARKTARIVTQAFIRLLVRAIERDVDAPGLVLPEERRPVLVDQRAVGVDRNQKAQRPQRCIQLLELRVDQRLAAREQQEQRARVLHLPGDGQPFLRRAQAALPLHLLARQAHIAHVAVHVAQRQQLDAAVDGQHLRAGAVNQRPLRRRCIFHMFHGISPYEKSRRIAPPAWVFVIRTLQFPKWPCPSSW